MSKLAGGEEGEEGEEGEDGEDGEDVGCDLLLPSRDPPRIELALR